MPFRRTLGSATSAARHSAWRSSGWTSSAVGAIAMVSSLGSGRRPTLGTANESPREFPCRLTLGVGLDTSDDRVTVTISTLHDPAATGRQVIEQLGLMHPQSVEVDDVEIGAVAGGQHATIMESDETSGVTGLTLDQELDIETSTVSISTPVLQQRRRERTVTDGADMGATVGERRDGVRMREQFVRAVEVALAEV